MAGKERCIDADLCGERVHLCGRSTQRRSAGNAGKVLACSETDTVFVSEIQDLGCRKYDFESSLHPYSPSLLAKVAQKKYFY